MYATRQKNANVQRQKGKQRQGINLRNKGRARGKYIDINGDRDISKRLG